jgi:hypothetical protein
MKKTGHTMTGQKCIHLYCYTLVLDDPLKIRESKNRTIKMKNNTLAIPAAPAATPPNPNIAAIIATIKKITVQRNMVKSFRFKK